eukprot:s4255_g2.t1
MHRRNIELASGDVRWWRVWRD